MRIPVVWRIVALIALLVYVLLVFLLVRVLLHNFGLALALGLTGLTLLWGAWLIFTGRQQRVIAGVVLLCIASVAAIVEFMYFAGSDNEQMPRIIVLVAALTALYLALIAKLRQVYWEEARQAGAFGKVGHFRRPYLIINPKSGDGRALKAHIPELAVEQGITIKLLQKGDDVEALARQAAREGADVLGVSGGDGSIGAVAKVALEQDLPMVVLPGGTRCHFARDLGLDPNRIADALAGFHGVERHVDVADINGRMFLNNVSFGLYADIVDSPGYREHKLRAGRNVLRDLLGGTKRLYDLRFHHGKQRFRRAAQVLVGVNKYKLLTVSELGQRERLDEGVLQITAVTKLNDALVAGLVKAMSFEKLRSAKLMPYFHQWTGKTFEMGSTKKTLVVGVDGEREEYDVPVRVRVRPGALRVYVPPEGVRGRPTHAFSLLTARRLWQSGAHAEPH